MSSSDGYHVIGGGIAGASVAYHLGERTDDPIVVYERDEIASATTAKSLAFFGFYGDATQFRMKRYAMELYNEFMANPRADPRYEACGLLRVATTPRGARTLAREGAAGASGGGDPAAVEARYLPPSDLRERVVLPYLDVDGLEGSLYRPQVGYTDPRAFAREFVARARENGVKFEEGTRVTDVETDDGRVEAVVTEDGRRPADAVVCAAGPWNPSVCERVGLDVPVRHTLAPVLEVEAPSETRYSLPWISHEESGFSIRRNADGRILMTHHPVGGYEAAAEYDPDAVPESVPEDLRSDALSTLRRLLPYADAGVVVDARGGVRASPPDGNPLVGWTDAEGFSLVAFNTSGIQLSPAAGDVIARQLVDDDPTHYYDALSISRFEGHSDWRGR
jgi:glycine/D-amino acid oxidase-like deaminating enzyme